MKTAVLVPAYNEEDTIGEVVSRIKKLGHTAVVVDDASSDKTYSVAKKAGGVVLRHGKNCGKGEAIKTGFDYIFKSLDADFIVLLDADLQYLPEDIPKLTGILERKEADFVMGYRDWTIVPFRHKFGNIVWRLFFNMFFGTKMKDTNCGFMAMTANTAKKIKGLGGGYVIDNHIVAEVVKNKLAIGQAPVRIYYKKNSGILRGLRMVAGVTVFIILEGVKYRLGKR